MNGNFGFLRQASAAAVLVCFATVAACTSDSNDPGAGTGSGGAMGGTGTGGVGGSTGGSGTGGAPAGSICASPIAISAAAPGIANFDAYDGVSDISTWSFPLGGDTVSGVYAGPFGYGDRATGFPETFEMATGHDSTYALRIADTMAEQYGGGMGTWLSACVNATAFKGVSFWVRGNSPMGSVTLTLSMADTLPSTPAKADDAVGTCTGDSVTCVHPTFSVPVTDTWTKIDAPWTAFTVGKAPGGSVAPDGRNITQVQFGVGLNWAPDTTGTYVAIPAPYELAVDTLTFY